MKNFVVVIIIPLLSLGFTAERGYDEKTVRSPAQNKGDWRSKKIEINYLTIGKDGIEGKDGITNIFISPFF